MKRRDKDRSCLLVLVLCISMTVLAGCQGFKNSGNAKKRKDSETVIVETQADSSAVDADKPEESEIKETESESLQASDSALDSDFQIHMIEVGDEVYNRIYGRSYVDNDDVALSDLRYLTVLHYDYDHQVQSGEIIVHKDVAENVIDIFKELYAEEYEIEGMRLIDDYWIEGDPAASDSYSIENNNTSAFCYRVITGGDYLSNHAYGCAIDLNPLQNPYVLFEDGETYCTDCSVQYIDREQDDPHIIREGDICWTIFTEHGFEWGGSWENPIDYQHFEFRHEKLD